MIHKYEYLMRNKQPIYRYVDLLHYKERSPYMFRPNIVAIFTEVFFEGHSRSLKFVGNCDVQNKSKNLYMHLYVISHKKSLVHGQ